MTPKLSETIEHDRSNCAHCSPLLKHVAALEERLQSEQKDRQLIAEALDRVAKEKNALDERLRQAEACSERIAQLRAHRACGSEEHDPAQGKIHGCCVVCLLAWPCAYAGTPVQAKRITVLEADNQRLKETMAAALRCSAPLEELKAKDEQIRRLREATSIFQRIQDRWTFGTKDWHLMAWAMQSDAKEGKKLAEAALTQTEEKK